MSDLRGTTCLRFDSFLKAEGKHFSAPPLNMLNIVHCIKNAWAPNSRQTGMATVSDSDTSHKTMTRHVSENEQCQPNCYIILYFHDNFRLSRDINE